MPTESNPLLADAEHRSRAALPGTVKMAQVPSDTATEFIFSPDDRGQLTKLAGRVNDLIKLTGVGTRDAGLNDVLGLMLLRGSLTLDDANRATFMLDPGIDGHELFKVLMQARGAEVPAVKLSRVVPDDGGENLLLADAERRARFGCP